MTCDSFSHLISLYDYGELRPEEEDRLEAHLHQCVACTREMERLRAVARALDRRNAAVPPQLLEEFRADLMAAIRSGAGASPWRLFRDAVRGSLAGLGRFQRPLAAAALLAIGFFAARITGDRIHLGPNLPGATLPGATSGEEFATVRSVHPDGSGNVQIAFDETRRRVISGRPGDREIQRLLLAAAHEENPAVRVESMGLLKDRSDSAEVRDALLNALAHDPNAGVRLKAIEGLKPLVADSEVRKTLAQTLTSDDNPAVRMQAVDLLVTHQDDSTVGMLQNLVQKEDNGYVRLKCEKALKEMNASVGTF